MYQQFQYFISVKIFNSFQYSHTILNLTFFIILLKTYKYSKWSKNPQVENNNNNKNTNITQYYHYDNVPRVLITEQEALEEFKRKHPDSKNLQFPPLPAGIVMQGQMDPITEDEIKTIILRIKKAKSPGEDGITGNT
ncbi:Hypothetical_protein [Hexamita inflata]|uniref:Hypothetical_protein n=1 Tax=Hexamita inflata TaxID=28002 RepID=A0AA86NPN0_9EUKA|nr:Hypothetical protein HINF_LOCUS11128 [Hexamita inflata]